MRKFLQFIGFFVVVSTLVVALLTAIYWIYLFGFTMPRIGH